MHILSAIRGHQALTDPSAAEVKDLLTNGHCLAVPALLAVPAGVPPDPPTTPHAQHADSPFVSILQE